MQLRTTNIQKPAHRSAAPSHYDRDADTYDAFNEENSRVMNRTLTRILKENRARTVVDFTCGTGSQVFWLHRSGFEVRGLDINARMLSVARRKARAAGLDLSFEPGDMRVVRTGGVEYDAALSMFNAVGHLTRRDFEKAVRNVRRALKPGGLYLFDINNLDYLLDGDNIAKLTIDWVRQEGRSRVRYIQYSTIDRRGILTSYTTMIDRQGRTRRGSQTLQVYSAARLKTMLERNGFRVQSQYDVNGAPFQPTESERILTVARKT